MPSSRPHPPEPERRLTPEEDSIGEPDDLDDEIDDLLPADLWFRFRVTHAPALPKRVTLKLD
jgi:hypothetical protein